MHDDKKYTLTYTYHAKKKIDVFSTETPITPNRSFTKALSVCITYTRALLGVSVMV